MPSVAGLQLCTLKLLRSTRCGAPSNCPSAKVAPPGGIDLGELAPRLPDLPRTPGGKVELAPALLIADLQRAPQTLDSPAPPLLVIARRDVRSNGNWMHHLPVLAKGPERCTALMHPAVATAAGLDDGAMAQFSAAAGVIIRLEWSDSMMPGAVSLPHGLEHGQPGTRVAVPAARPGANLNVLRDDAARNPLAGNAELAGQAVVARTAAA